MAVDPPTVRYAGQFRIMPTIKIILDPVAGYFVQVYRAFNRQPNLTAADLAKEVTYLTDDQRVITIWEDEDGDAGMLQPGTHYFKVRSGIMVPTPDFSTTVDFSIEVKAGVDLVAQATADRQDYKELLRVALDRVFRDIGALVLADLEGGYEFDKVDFPIPVLHAYPPFEKAKYPFVVIDSESRIVTERNIGDFGRPDDNGNIRLSYVDERTYKLVAVCKDDFTRRLMARLMIDAVDFARDWLAAEGMQNLELQTSLPTIQPDPGSPLQFRVDGTATCKTTREYLLLPVPLSTSSERTTTIEYQEFDGETLAGHDE
jgi:hypothetical protein